MMSLPQLPQDKANHALYGVAIFIVAAALLGPAEGLACAIVAGAAKEIYDSTAGGEVSAWDFWSTAAGGLAGFLCTLI